MPVFLSPVTVESINFKNRMEISDFGDMSERGSTHPQFNNPLIQVIEGYKTDDQSGEESQRLT